MTEELIPAGVSVFAVVGRINMGKSAVLATLLEVDDDQVIRVDPTPGATTHCQTLPVRFGGRELTRFIDTPGFSRPLEAMRAIQEMHGEGTPDLETVRKFVAAHLEGGDFEDEARLLEPIVGGAGILYVIDPSKPLRDAFVAEMEILRWTGRPRMALLNQKGEEAQEKEWRERLGSYFNLVRTFNAHRARFEERKRLMASLLEIDERHRAALEEAIGLIDTEWEERREEAADVVLGLLEEALTLRVEARLEDQDERMEHRRERKAKELALQYVEKVRRMEKKAYERLLKIYRHHLVTVEAGEAYEGIDLEAAETWKKWGLSRGQLTVAGLLAGAAGGAVVDVSTGGLTHGGGAIVGGLLGAGGAFFKGADLPELGFLGGLKVSSGSGKKLVLGPPKSENFPWILLDSALHHHAAMVRRAHGRRDAGVLEEESGESLVRDLPRGDRSVLAKWFGSCAKGAPDRGMTPEVFRVLVECLRGAEG